MKIRCISRNNAPLKISIHRSVLLNQSFKKCVTYADRALVDNGNSVVLIKGPIQENEQLLIVCRDNNEDPYIASSGSCSRIELLENSDGPILKLTAYPDKDRTQSYNNVTKILNNVWCAIFEIFKRKEEHVSKIKNGMNIKSIDRVNLEDEIRRLFVSYPDKRSRAKPMPRFGKLDQAELANFINNATKLPKEKGSLPHAKLALSIIGLYKTSEFIKENGFNNHVEVYRLMFDASWINNLLKVPRYLRLLSELKAE